MAGVEMFLFGGAVCAAANYIFGAAGGVYGIAAAVKSKFDQRVYNTVTVDMHKAPDTYRRICMYLNYGGRESFFKSNCQVVEIFGKAFLIPANGHGHWFQTWKGFIHIASEGSSFVVTAKKELFDMLYKRVLSTVYAVTGTIDNKPVKFFVAVWPGEEEAFLKSMDQPVADISLHGYIIERSE